MLVRPDYTGWYSGASKSFPIIYDIGGDRPFLLYSLVRFAESSASNSSMEHENMSAAEHRDKSNWLLEIARVMVEHEDYYGATLAIAQAADHFGQAGYLDAKASDEAEGVEHEPYRPCVACTVEWMAESVYRAAGYKRGE